MQNSTNIVDLEVINMLWMIQKMFAINAIQLSKYFWASPKFQLKKNWTKLDKKLKISNFFFFGICHIFWFEHGIRAQLFQFLESNTFPDIQKASSSHQ